MDNLMLDTLHKIMGTGRKAVIGGDFNMHPETMEAWLVRHDLPFTTVAQEKFTFEENDKASNIDYFVSSIEIAAALSPPKLVMMAGLAGHSPVRTQWSKAVLQQWVTVWERPLRCSPYACHRPDAGHGRARPAV